MAGLDSLLGGFEGMGSLGSVFESVTGMILPTLVALLVVAVLGIATYIIIKKAKYNIRVIIFSKRKGRDKVLDDIGGYFKTKGINSFKLKKMKIAIQPPKFDYLFPTSKGNVLFLRQQGQDEFYPLMPSISIKQGLDLQVISGDTKLWGVTMMQRIREMYQKPSFFEKYGSYIIFGVTAMMVLVLIYVVLQKFDILEQVAQHLENTARILKETAIAFESGAPQ